MANLIFSGYEINKMIRHPMLIVTKTGILLLIKFVIVIKAVTITNKMMCHG
jgi:hypothetical protein